MSMNMFSRRILAPVATADGYLARGMGYTSCHRYHFDSKGAHRGFRGSMSSWWGSRQVIDF